MTGHGTAPARRSSRLSWPAGARGAIAGAVLAMAAMTAIAAIAAAPQPMRELRFPAFEQRTLPNGLRLVVIERHGEPEVSLRLMLPAGKLYEPAGKAGLASATADLLTQGTASRSAQQIAAAIDGVGGSSTPAPAPTSPMSRRRSPPTSSTSPSSCSPTWCSTPASPPPRSSAGGTRA